MWGHPDHNRRLESLPGWQFDFLEKGLHHLCHEGRYEE